ncbi:MAG: TonB-dependent receptor [Candidatus Aminicenantales bacterium]
MLKNWIAGVFLCTCFAFPQDTHEIVVLGKKIPFRFDPKRDVLVVEGEFLRQIPSFNLAQLISLVANMHFVSRGNFQADPQMSGFNQEQIVVMVNGTPWNNAQTGHHNLALPFDIEQIERIEVLRGGYPSRNNLSGAGGLVNIITSSGSGFKASLSSFDTKAASLSLRAKSLNFSSGITSTDGYMEGIDGEKYYAQGGIKLPYDRGLLDIWAGWLSSRFGARNFYGPYPSFEELDRFLGSVNWQMIPSRNALLDIQISSQYSHDIFTLDRNRPAQYANTHKTLQNSLNVSFHQYSKELSYTLGVSSDGDRIDSRGTRESQAAVALGEHRRQMFSFFGEFHAERGLFFLNSGLQMAFGSYNNWSGHFMAGVMAGSDLKISGSVSRNYRIPTYTELFYSDPSHQANAGLMPETSVSSSFSIESHKKRLEWGIKLFFNRSNNLIEWKSASGGNFWLSENLKKGTYYGTDVKLFFMSGNAVVRILYTFQNASFDEHPLMKTLKYHYYFPDHSLSVLLSQSFRILSLCAALKIEREKWTGVGRVYLNLKARRKFGNAAPFIEVLNIFNSRAEKIPGLPEPPRSFTAGLAIDF